MVYADSREAVEHERARFLRKWRLRCKAVVSSLDEAGEELFTYLQFPPSQWKALRTTNALERVNGEFRRRTKTQPVRVVPTRCDLPAPSTDSSSASTIVSIIRRTRSRISTSIVSGPHSNLSSSTAFLLSLSIGVIFLYSPASECGSLSELAR